MRFSFRSLSFRLLLLTVFFVMLAEVLIYTPSVARFRQVYLTEKLDSAHLAAMAGVLAPRGPDAEGPPPAPPTNRMGAVISPDGRLVGWFATATSPTSEELLEAVEAHLPGK